VCCLLAGEVLPTSNDHVSVLRIELHHAAGAASTSPYMTPPRRSGSYKGQSAA
jgi:hypothetical protein